jgi:hypothetical protein
MSQGQCQIFFNQLMIFTSIDWIIDGNGEPAPITVTVPENMGQSPERCGS